MGAPSSILVPRESDVPAGPDRRHPDQCQLELAAPAIDALAQFSTSDVNRGLVVDNGRLAGQFDAAALVTAKMPLDGVNDAFAAMERQEGIRTVLTFDT